MDYKKKYLELKEQVEKACNTQEEKERLASETAFFEQNGLEEYIALATDLVNSLACFGSDLKGSVLDSLFVTKCSNFSQKESKPAVSFEEFSKSPLNLSLDIIGPNDSQIVKKLKLVAKCAEPILKESGLECRELLLTTLASGAHMGERIIVSKRAIDETQVTQLKAVEALSSQAAKQVFLMDIFCYRGL